MTKTRHDHPQGSAQMLCKELGFSELLLKIASKKGQNFCLKPLEISWALRSHFLSIYVGLKMRALNLFDTLLCIASVLSTLVLRDASFIPFHCTPFKIFPYLFVNRPYQFLLATASQITVCNHQKLSQLDDVEQCKEDSAAVTVLLSYNMAFFWGRLLLNCAKATLRLLLFG